MGEIDMKDVACVVTTPINKNGYFNRYKYTIYLIDLRRQKLRAYLHLNNYPYAFGSIVHNCMFYMFGGCLGDSHELCDTYGLDLSQLIAKNAAENRLDTTLPMPTKLTPMKCAKYSPSVLLVRNKLICVFEDVLGHQPRDSHFELYDPEQNTWTNIRDPFHLKPGLFVSAHFVTDDKLFLYIRGKLGIYLLNFPSATNSSPFWSHLEISYNLGDGFAEEKMGVKIGSFIVCTNEAYAIDSNGCVTHRSGYVDCTGEGPAQKRYRFCERGDGCIFGLTGSNRVCTIYQWLLGKRNHGNKPKNTRRQPQSDSGNGKSLFLRQPLIRRCGRVRRKGSSYRFVLDICGVNTSDPKDIRLEVLDSFTVPMYKNGKSDGWGDIIEASLCDL